MKLYLLELDPEEVDGPFVAAVRGPLSELRCEACRSTWFDPVPGPLAIDVDSPEDGWDTFRPGVLPAEDAPILLVDPAMVEGLRALGVNSFEAHPVVVEAVDDEPVPAPSAGGSPEAGPPWVALWPTGRCTGATRSDGEAWLPCPACGRFDGEFEAPFAGRLRTDAWDGSDLFTLPGWRCATFVSERGWEALKALGVKMLRVREVG